MAARGLAEYFTEAGQRQALEAYGRFAKGSVWSVPHKMDLYDLAASAFTPPGDLRSFEGIYGSLVSYWQVFRPHGAGQCWPAPKVFDALRTGLAEFGRAGGVGLHNFATSGRQHAMMFALMELRDLKPTAGYPTMAVSKFLHFFNPSLFPIYDTAVVQNKVFARFGADYRSLCASCGLDAAADGAAFLRNYAWWAGTLVAGAGPGFMERFASWLEDELPRRRFAEFDRGSLQTLYATAFEFTAIGAAVCEGY